jgi:hypothetical protein
LQREAARILNPRRERAQHILNVPGFIANACEYREVCVSRQARFTPMQHCDAADEAERPMLARAEVLNFTRCVQQTVT